MIEPCFTLFYDQQVPNIESHQHRIVRLYKRAVQDRTEKVWGHFFKFGNRVVNFILIPMNSFYDVAPLIESSKVRYDRVMEFAEKAKGIDQVRFDEMHDSLVLAHQARDWVQEVDLLDDLEDFISETDCEQAPIKLARLNQYINTFNFISIKRKPDDEELQKAIECLNKIAKIYFLSNFIVRSGHFKRQIDQLVREFNVRRIKKEIFLQKIDDLKNLLLDSFSKSNLTRSIKMFSTFDPSVKLKTINKEKLLESLDNENKDEDFALSLISVIDEFSGENLLKARKVSRVSFSKSHWNSRFNDLKKIVGFLKIKLPIDLARDFEKLKSLLEQEAPDNDLLEAMIEDLTPRLLRICSGEILAKFEAYKKSPLAVQKKITSINNQLHSLNIISAYIRIIDL